MAWHGERKRHSEAALKKRKKGVKKISSETFRKRIDTIKENEDRIIRDIENKIDELKSLANRR
jgi:septin family protein